MIFRLYIYKNGCNEVMQVIQFFKALSDITRLKIVMFSARK